MKHRINDIMYIVFNTEVKKYFNYSRSVANPKKNPVFPRANEGTRNFLSS